MREAPREGVPSKPGLGISAVLDWAGYRKTQTCSHSDATRSCSMMKDPPKTLPPPLMCRDVKHTEGALRSRLARYCRHHAQGVEAAAAAGDVSGLCALASTRSLFAVRQDDQSILFFITTDHLHIKGSKH